MNDEIEIYDNPNRWHGENCAGCGELKSNCRAADGRFWHYRCYRTAYPIKGVK